MVAVRGNVGGNKNQVDEDNMFYSNPRCQGSGPRGRRLPPFEYFGWVRRLYRSKLGFPLRRKIR